MLDFLESYLIAGMLGLSIGIFATHRYYRKTVRNASLGKIIEVSLIEKKISELESEINILNETVERLREIGEALEEEVKHSKDIEMFYREKFNTKELKKEIEDI
jgi:hypothetical protein